MTLDQAVSVIDQLSLADKLRLIEQIMPRIQQQLAVIQPEPKRSLYGLCQDLGAAPSAAAIDEVRQEMWANFGQENIL
jgi:hypothetical protein